MDDDEREARMRAWRERRETRLARKEAAQANAPARRLNSAERRMLRAESLRLFLKQAGRKAQKGIEPNDRKYDSDVQRSVRRMRADVLDRLLRDGDDE